MSSLSAANALQRKIWESEQRMHPVAIHSRKALDAVDELQRLDAGASGASSSSATAAPSAAIGAARHKSLMDELRSELAQVHSPKAGVGRVRPSGSHGTANAMNQGVLPGENTLSGTIAFTNAQAQLEAVKNPSSAHAEPESKTIIDGKVQPMNPKAFELSLKALLKDTPELQKRVDSVIADRAANGGGRRRRWRERSDITKPRAASRIVVDVKEDASPDLVDQFIKDFNEMLALAPRDVLVEFSRLKAKEEGSKDQLILTTVTFDQSVDPFEEISQGLVEEFLHLEEEYSEDLLNDMPSVFRSLLFRLETPESVSDFLKSNRGPMQACRGAKLSFEMAMRHKFRRRINNCAEGAITKNGADELDSYEEKSLMLLFMASAAAGAARRMHVDATLTQPEVVLFQSVRNYADRIRKRWTRSQDFDIKKILHVTGTVPEETVLNAYREPLLPAQMTGERQQEMCENLLFEILSEKPPGAEGTAFGAARLIQSVESLTTMTLKHHVQLQFTGFGDIDFPTSKATLKDKIKNRQLTAGVDESDIKDLDNDRIRGASREIPLFFPKFKEDNQNRPALAALGLDVEPERFQNEYALRNSALRVLLLPLCTKDELPKEEVKTFNETIENFLKNTVSADTVDASYERIRRIEARIAKNGPYNRREEDEEEDALAFETGEDQGLITGEGTFRRVKLVTAEDGGRTVEFLTMVRAPTENVSKLQRLSKMLRTVAGFFDAVVVVANSTEEVTACVAAQKDAEDSPLMRLGKQAPLAILCTSDETASDLKAVESAATKSMLAGLEEERESQKSDPSRGLCDHIESIKAFDGRLSSSSSELGKDVMSYILSSVKSRNEKCAPGKGPLSPMDWA